MTQGLSVHQAECLRTASPESTPAREACPRRPNRFLQTIRTASNKQDSTRRLTSTPVVEVRRITQHNVFPEATIVAEILAVDFALCVSLSEQTQAAIAALDAAIVSDEGRRHVDKISPARHQCLIEARDDHGRGRTTAGPGPRVARCRHRPCEGRLRGDN